MLSNSKMTTFFQHSNLDEKITNAQLTPVNFHGQRELLILDIFRVIGDKKYKNFFDPFSGSGSISFAAMSGNIAQNYHINDSDPIFKNIWLAIKENSEEFIAEYKDYVKNYCDLSEDKRANYYNELLSRFNNLKKKNELKAGVALFTFLIGFASKNMPLFGEEFQLATTPNIATDHDAEEKKLQEFINRTNNLNKKFNSLNVKLYSGNFQECIESVTNEDLVILDPPYPSQSQSVYYKLKSEQELQQNLRNCMEGLNKKGIHFLILYGAVAVALHNQFNEEHYNVHHLVRLSTSPIHGDGLEHIYVSRHTNLTKERLPVHMAFYHDYFPKDKEITPEIYQIALKDLQSKRDQNNLNINVSRPAYAL